MDTSTSVLDTGFIDTADESVHPNNSNGAPGYDSRQMW